MPPAYLRGSPTNPVPDPVDLCGGRDAFPNQMTAESSIRRGRRDIHPYRCPHCHKWHLGHNKWHIAKSAR